MREDGPGVLASEGRTSWEQCWTGASDEIQLVDADPPGGKDAVVAPALVAEALGARKAVERQPGG
eukprot:5740475-Alexandrium_andersonii.AAC.1